MVLLALLALNYGIHMFLHKEARTNNRFEGYNFKLGSKKMLNKHPNGYVLACHS